MMLIFPLSVLKRRFTLLQSTIINADGGNPGFSCELIDCGNSMECIAVEIYFASACDTQTVITQFIREQTNKGTSLNWDTLQTARCSGTRGKMRSTVIRILFIKIRSKAQTRANVFSVFLSVLVMVEWNLFLDYCSFHL